MQLFSVLYISRGNQPCKIKEVVNLKYSHVLTQQMIDSIEQTEIDYATDRMLAIAGRAGNPEGVTIRNFDGMTALYSLTMPWAQFNTVKGIRQHHLAHLSELFIWYREKERKAQLEIVPSHVNEQFLKSLTELGWVQSGFHTSMYSILKQGDETDAQDLASDQITIRELREDEVEQYATIHCRGTGLTDEGIPYVAANNRVLQGRLGWRMYLASYNNEPAAVGVMYMKNKKASLTFAATLLDYRHKGLHQALIRHRIMEAQAEQCSLVVAQCAYGSSSMRNMQRCGLEVGYVRSSWTEREG